jgi:hypothetical protein
MDAVGPDVFEFRELVTTIRRALGARCLVVGLPPASPSWAPGSSAGSVSDQAKPARTDQVKTSH